VTDDKRFAGSSFGAAMEQAYLAECEDVEIEVPPRWMVVLGTIFSRCYRICVECKEKISRGYGDVGRWISKTLSDSSRPRKKKRSKRISTIP